MTDMTRSTYTCFYTNKPFWAIERPDLDAPEFSSEFTKKMSEIVFARDIEGISLRIARDGLIELRDQCLEERAQSRNKKFQELAQMWSEYLQLANSVFLMLDMAAVAAQNFALFDFQEVTRKDAFRMSYENGKFSSSGVSIESVSGSYQMGRFLSNYQPGLPLSHDPRISFRQVVREKTLSLLSEYISQSLKVHGLLEKLYSLAKSLSEYKVGNYKVCIVLCWFVIEEILNEKYKDFLKNKNCQVGKKKRINSKRKSLLTSRDFTASVVSNILELSDVISLAQFNSVDKIRRMRNDIAHGINKMQISGDDSAEALAFTAEFLLEGVISSPKLNLSLSSQGL